MENKKKWSHYDSACSIWFKIPFTIYWVGRTQLGCKHEWTPLKLFKKIFDGQYEWEEL